MNPIVQSLLRPGSLVPNPARLALLLGLGCFTLTASRCLADRATYDPTKTELAFPMSAPPVIDGVIDAAEWGPATPAWGVTVNSLLTDGIQGGTMTGGTVPPADNDDLSFQIRASYDANNLYVAVRVRDSVIQTDSAEADSKNGNTWMDDSVEVFVDGANANDAAWAAGQLGGQFVITANNAYRENEAGNPGFGESAAWFAKTTATDTGYDAEFRISLSALGNPKPGDIIGFSVGVNDDDDGGDVDRQVMWAGLSHKPVSYGNLVLGGKSYSAPKAGAPTIDGVIHASEYPGAAEIKTDSSNGIYTLDGGDDTWAAGDHAFSAWVTYDADAVYVAVDVSDDQIVTDTAEAGSEDQNTWEDDSVEIFFDADNDREAAKGTLGFEGQYVLTANGAHRDNEANNPTFGQDADWFAATSKTAGGYQVEFKVKKSALSNPVDGATIGFHVAINDDDGGTPAPKMQLGWSGYAHQEFSYGQLTLAGTNGPVVNFTNITITSTKVNADKLELTFTTPKPSSTHVLEQTFKLPASAWTNVADVSFSAPAGDSLVATFAKPSSSPVFYQIRLGDTPVVPACIKTPALDSWVNTAFANQTGTFTAQFEATPSADLIDGVMGLSSGASTAFTGFGCLFRFSNTGVIEARNGGAYEAITEIPYSANTQYNFRFVVNIPSHTYSVYVTPAGGTEQTVGTDFGFRTEQETVSNLNNWGATLTSSGAEGDINVCNFRVSSP